MAHPRTRGTLDDKIVHKTFVREIVECPQMPRKVDQHAKHGGEPCEQASAVAGMADFTDCQALKQLSI